MNAPAGYTLGGYGEMIAPTQRMHGYLAALRKAIRPGSIVLDIGAGTGIFSLLACKLGAGHVHSVEPDDAVLLGHTFAADNGFAGRITFHQQLSSRVSLPTQADVIVSDLRGIIPLFQHHIPAIIDARQRLLAPGGVLIPMRDVLYGSMIESPELYARYQEPWLKNEFGLNLTAAHPMAVNSWKKARINPQQLLTAPQVWCTLDYRTIDAPDVKGELSWTVQRAGVAHGLGLWFDAELADGIGFSNAPGEPDLVYGQAFFPLQHEVALEIGDRLSIVLSANLVGANYIFSWQTSVQTQRGTKASFRQSTFLGEVVSLAKMKRTEVHFAPSPTQEMEIDRQCLALADGLTCLGDMARALTEQFPQRFARSQDALAYVANLFEAYAPATAPALIVKGG